MSIGEHCFNLALDSAPNIAVMDGGIAKSEGSSGSRTWLVFSVGPYAMCASALDVEGIMQRPGAIARLPFMPDYVLGAFVFRGRSAAAISLRRKLNLADAINGRDGPFIVARIGTSIAAFCVDEVRDVVDERNLEWRPLPELLTESLVERIGIHGTALVLQTSFASLRDARMESGSLVGWAASQPVAAPPALGETQEPQPIAVEQTRATPEAVLTPPPAVPRPLCSQSKTVARRAFQSVGATRTAHRAPAARLNPGKRTAIPTTLNEAPTAVACQMASSAEPGVQPRTASGSTRSAFAGTLGVMLVICVGVLAAVFYHLLAAPRRGKPPVATVTVQPPLVRAPATSALQERPDVAERVDRQKPATVTVTIERGNAEAHKTAGTAVHVHTVVPGDTLWRIAKKQVGDPYRYPELARLSNIRNPDLIRPGDVVRIEIRSER